MSEHRSIGCTFFACPGRNTVCSNDAACQSVKYRRCLCPSSGAVRFIKMWATRSTVSAVRICKLCNSRSYALTSINASNLAITSNFLVKKGTKRVSRRELRKWLASRRSQEEQIRPWRRRVVRPRGGYVEGPTGPRPRSIKAIGRLRWEWCYSESDSG